MPTWSPLSKNYYECHGGDSRAFNQAQGPSKCEVLWWDSTGRSAEAGPVFRSPPKPGAVKEPILGSLALRQALISLPCASAIPALSTLGCHCSVSTYFSQGLELCEGRIWGWDGPHCVPSITLCTGQGSTKH